MCFKYICFYSWKYIKKGKIKKNGKKNKKIKLDFFECLELSFVGGCFLYYFFLNKKK